VAEAHPYDLAIIDMQMPGMDGLATANAIRAIPSIASTRLVLLSSVALRGQAKAARAMGFAGYLTKPIRQSALHDCIATVMGLPADTLRDSAVSAPLVTRHTLAEARAAGRARILVAEDNQINQQVALGILQRLGHHADLAANGLEAVEAVRRLPYDLVLMDCQMPDMDGFEATAEIRRLQGTGARIAIVAMTANAMQGDRERCLAAGMDDYLTKPVCGDKLAATLERWLPNGRGPRTGVDMSGTDGPSPEPAPSPVGGPPLINLDQLESIVGKDNRDGLRRYFRLYLASAEPLLAQSLAAVAARDSAEATRLGHALKGGSGNVGAEEMAGLAAELEKAAASGDWPRAGELCHSLKQSFARVTTFTGSL
jgi:CheY-like chemotaxis protein/HPt (histidine-containing phosphotransfer) domain-containing protein